MKSGIGFNDGDEGHNEQKNHDRSRQCYGQGKGCQWIMMWCTKMKNREGSWRRWREKGQDEAARVPRGNAECNNEGGTLYIEEPQVDDMANEAERR